MEAFLSHVASQAVLALRWNLENSQGDGQPLAPLGIWDRLRFTGGIGEGRWTRADRSNDDKPLVDTGGLLESINVSKVTARREGGNIVVEIEVSAAEYGNQYTEDRTYSDVHLGRTKQIRASRDFAGGREGRDFVTVKTLRVPARPWNRISRTKLQEIANGAVKGARG